MSCERHRDTAPGDAPDCPDCPDYPECNPSPTAPWNQDAWEQRGAELAKNDNVNRWQLGDWMLEADRRVYNVYDTAQHVTGLQHGHLKDLASVSRRIPACDRSHALSWTHHRTLANGHKKDEPPLTLEQIKGWIDKAVAGEWSVNRLKREMRGGIGSKPRPTTRVVLELSPAIHTTLRCFAAADKLRAAASLDGLPVTSIDGSVPLNSMTAHMATENFKLVRKEIGACASNITAKEVSAVATKLLLEYLNSPDMARLVAETREFAMPTGRAARLKKQFRKAESAARKAERKAAARAAAARASREAEARKAEEYARSQDHRRLRISFKSNPEDKARKLLEALPDATGAKRANVLQRLKALVEKHAKHLEQREPWNNVLVALAAEPQPEPPKRKKSPAVGGVRKMTKKAQRAARAGGRRRSGSEPTGTGTRAGTGRAGSGRRARVIVLRTRTTPTH